MRVKEWYQSINGLLFYSGLPTLEPLELNEVFEDYHTYCDMYQIVESMYFNYDFAERHINPQISESGADAVSDYVRYKWLVENAYTIKRMYGTISAEYNPIENYDRYEESTDSTTSTGASTDIKGEASTTFGSRTDTVNSNTSIGAQTQTDTYGERSTSTSYGQDATTHAHGAQSTSTEYGDTAGQTIVEGDVTAFTSANYLNDNRTTTDSTTDTHTDTIESIAYSDVDTRAAHSDSTLEARHIDTHEQGARSDTASGTTNIGAHTDTESSRTDTHTSNGAGTATHTGHLHGNIGVTTSQQMLESEREVARFSFWKWLYLSIVDAITIEVI